ncbi:hypothetical protein [Pacificispira sp.]|uniref:hypothetical protein n=2 Tax=Alphaproteobacteria TaxID=28211 RepID=UPI003B515F1B
MVLQSLRLLIPLLTIAGVHLCIVYGFGLYAISCLAAAVGINAVLAALTRQARAVVLTLTGIAVGLAVLQITAVLIIPDMARIVALPPVLIHGWVAWMFGRTLLPGQEPLIRRFSRLHRDPFPPELEGYTRRLTVIWTILLSGLTLTSAGLGVFAAPETWSWAVNIAMPLICVSLFLGEHAYRGIVFRHIGGHSPVVTMRTLMSPKTWIAS